MTRPLAARAALALALTWASPASALFPERYVACTEERAKGSEAFEAPPDPSQPRPLPRRGPPALLEVAPLIVIDVPTPGLVPSGHKEVGALAEAPAPLFESTNDYRCIGLPRGKAGILRVVGAPPGTRFRDHPYPTSWVETNMRAAATFALTEVAPSLIRTLERGVPAALEPWQKLERLRLRSSAALALADLGEPSAKAPILSLVVERQEADYPGFWEDGLDALGRLDPPGAHDYAVQSLERFASTPDHDTREDNQMRKLLPLLVRPDPAALKALKAVHLQIDPKLSGSGHASCLVFAARVRAGDAPLRAELAKELSTDLRTNRSAVCFSEAMAAVFPGEDPDELDALLLRHRYRELLSLVRGMQQRQAAGDADPRFEPTRAKLRAWLVKRAGDPDIVKDVTDRRFDPVDRVRHLALGAALGDSAAHKDLISTVVDPKDDGIAPFIGASAALDLGLAGAADAAAKRLSLSLTVHTERRSSEPWARRGWVTVTEHVELIDRLAARGDARFALGLLDRQIHAREATALLLARKKPKQACAVVARAASGAEEHAIQDALWALSILGSSCAAELEALFTDPSATAAARGMALEALAMLREPAIASALAVDPPKDTIRPARQRARIIASSPE